MSQVNEKPSYDTAPAGSIRFNTDSAKMEIYNGEQWWEVDSTSPEQQTGATRGLFGGGYSPGLFQIVSSINVDTTGAPVAFGNLAAGSRGVTAMGSRTRAVFTGGYEPGFSNRIQFNDFAREDTSGFNGTTDFGDLSTGAFNPASMSNSTRGIITSMEASGSPIAQLNNIIEFITIASTGDAVDFGDQVTVSRHSAPMTSPTRGVYFGGVGPSPGVTNTIQYVTISTQGDSKDFGDCVSSRNTGPSAGSNATRGLLVHAYDGNPGVTTGVSTIQLSTLGDSVDFGDLTVARYNSASMASKTRLVVGGGQTPTLKNEIDYKQFASTGDFFDFGNLETSLSQLAGCSNGHGGLG